ncbi:MAG: anti-sigma regulatory factor [Myxococcaceae bacterium]
MERQLTTVLGRYLPVMAASGVVLTLKRRTAWDGRPPSEPQVKRLEEELRDIVPSHLPDFVARRRCLSEIQTLLRSQTSRAVQGTKVIPILGEIDVIRSRVEAGEIARDLGCSPIDQMRVATAVSELARNIVNYAGTGEICLSPITDPTGRRKGLEIVASDKGPGIASVDVIMSGSYKSKKGMGMGLLGVKRLMDDFELKTALLKGTTVRCVKYLPDD